MTCDLGDIVVLVGVVMPSFVDFHRLSVKIMKVLASVQREMHFSRDPISLLRFII